MEGLTQNPGYYYIAKSIFSSLDSKSLTTCRLVCKSWCEFIDYEILNWIQILIYQSVKLQDWLDHHESWKEAIENICEEVNVDKAKKMIVVLLQSKDFLMFEATPLRQATYAGDFDTIEFLVPNVIKNKELGLLTLAVTRGHFQIVKYLIEHEYDADEVDVDGQSPLHAAADLGDLQLFKEIWKKANLKSPEDKEGYTPIHNACLNGHLPIYKFIAAKCGRDYNPVSKRGYSILHAAAKNGNIELIKEILEVTEDKCPRNVRGQTPMHLAVEAGYIDVLQLFHKSVKEHRNPSDNAGVNLLHISAEKGHLDIFKYLFKLEQSKTKKNPQDANGITPLHLAAENGHIDIVTMILDSNVQDKSPKDGMNRLPIHLAAKNGHFEIVIILIPTCKDVHARDKFNKTPGNYASMKGHFKIVDILTKSSKTGPLRGAMGLKSALSSTMAFGGDNVTNAWYKRRMKALGFD